MNWLHCCWGVGAAISPYIMSWALTGAQGWTSGYRTVSIIQFALTAVLFLSLPLWKRQKRARQATQQPPAAPLRLSQVLRIRGVIYVLLAFFGYCALETTAGLWASSYLVQGRGIEAVTAAAYASFFYLGITVGRFLSGFFADKIGDRNMIRIGLVVMAAGIAAILLPFSAQWPCLAGLAVTVLGCAPVYPAVIHSTPANFGAQNSQAIVGVQMASAYLGSTLMPPLFGLLAGSIGVWLYPLFLLCFVALMAVMTERLNRVVGSLPEV